MTDKGPIVVGTDGSDRAERAVERAGDLAQALDVPVHVVSGYRAAVDIGRVTPIPGAVGSAGGSDGEDHPRRHAENFAERAQRRLEARGVQSLSHVVPGDPAEVLIMVADEQHAQMIVVGNRGMSGARRMLGSVPNSVSHQARCGVLIVPTA